jgi:hypothetical protein
MFLVKPVFCRHFWKLLAATPSAEMTKGYTDTILSFQIFLISRAKFSCFVIFPDSVLGRLWVKGTAVSNTVAVLFSLSTNTVSGLLKSTVLLVYYYYYYYYYWTPI